MDNKRRRRFLLYSAPTPKPLFLIGEGVCYDEGNVQVYMRPSWFETYKPNSDIERSTAWQFASLADALKIEGVVSFCWEG